MTKWKCLICDWVGTSNEVVVMYRYYIEHKEMFSDVYKRNTNGKSICTCPMCNQIRQVYEWDGEKYVRGMQ